MDLLLLPFLMLKYPEDTLPLWWLLGFAIIAFC